MDIAIIDIILEVVLVLPLKLKVDFIDLGKLKEL